MWFAKRGWHLRPQASQFATPTINSNPNTNTHAISTINPAINFLANFLVNAIISTSIMSGFTVSHPFPFPTVMRRCHDPRWGWPCGGERGDLAAHNLSSICNVVHLRRRPFGTSSIPVVRHMNANLRYRQSTFLRSSTLRLQRRATVVTRLRRASPLVSAPSATRRDLGQSRWASSWWSPPAPGRGRGTGWTSFHVGARRGPGVFLRRTLLTVAMPAPSGVAMTSRCRRARSRLVIVGA